MPTLPSLSQLLNALTPAQIATMIESFLQNAGLPSTNWSPVSEPMLMLQSEVQVLSALQQQILNLGAAGFLQLAASPQLQAGPGGTSPWVDLIAQQFYNQARRQPQPTIGPFQLSAPLGAGPYQITAGQLTIVDNLGDSYTNLGPFTITGGTPIVVTVTASTPGSQANIPNTTPLTLQTSLAGVTVTPFPSGGSTPWYYTPLAGSQAQAGSDIESDQALIAQCVNSWAALGTGSPVGAILNWVFAASNEVRYASVRATGLGSLRVVVYGNNGPVSAQGLAQIAAYLNPRLATCSFIAPGFPQNALTVLINPTAPAPNSTYSVVSVQYWYTSTASPVALIAAIQAALNLLVLSTPLGGYPIVPGTPDQYGISNALFVEAIMNANPAITRCQVLVSNYLGASGLQPSDASPPDLILPVIAGVPAALQAPTGPSNPWQISGTPL